MGFRVDSFRDAAFSQRTTSLTAKELPSLKDWFDGDVAWTVRGLTYDEIVKCQEISSAGQDIAVLLAKAVADPKKGRNANQIREALGFGEDVHRNTRLRIEHLVTCSVDPVCDNQIAAKLARVYPIEFRTLTDKILEMTGLGQVTEGESRPSGETKPSEAGLRSPTPEGDSSTSASRTNSPTAT